MIRIHPSTRHPNGAIEYERKIFSDSTYQCDRFSNEHSWPYFAHLLHLSSPSPFSLRPSSCYFMFCRPGPQDASLPPARPNVHTSAPCPPCHRSHLFAVSILTIRALFHRLSLGRVAGLPTFLDASLLPQTHHRFAVATRLTPRQVEPI